MPEKFCHYVYTLENFNQTNYSKFSVYLFHWAFGIHIKLRQTHSTIYVFINSFKIDNYTRKWLGAKV